MAKKYLERLLAHRSTFAWYFSPQVIFPHIFFRENEGNLASSWVVLVTMYFRDVSHFLQSGELPKAHIALASI